MAKLFGVWPVRREMDDAVKLIRAAELEPRAFPLLGEPPFTLGWDVSGVVEEVVPGVSECEANCAHHRRCG